MFAFIAANFNAKLKLVRSRTQDPLGMSSTAGTSSRNGSIKDRVHRTVFFRADPSVLTVKTRLNGLDNPDLREVSIRQKKKILIMDHRDIIKTSNG